MLLPSLSGSTVSCTSFQISGLGNTAATSQLTISGQFDIQCRNHGGQIVEAHSATQTASSGIAPLTTKSGKATVPPLSVTLTEPSNPTAFCPNGNWQGTVTGFTVDSATLTVFQNGGIVFQTQATIA